MKHFFYLNLDSDNEQFVFDTGSWEVLHLTEDVEEIRVFTSLGYIDLILIYCLLGHFLFIPAQNFGVTIDDLTDIEGNKRLLSWLPDSKNATVISAALHDYAS